MPSAAPPSAEASDEPRIAFVRFDSLGEEDQEAGAGVPGGVFVIGLGSGQLTKVSINLDRVVPIAPGWSPNGRQIAFGGVEDLNADGAYGVDESGIYVTNLDTGEMRRAASGRLGGWRLSWSPAGQLLLVTGMQSGNPVPFVYALETSSGITYTHPEIGQITTACWSPQGDLIAAYSREDHQIHMLDSEGNQVFTFEAPHGDVLELIWASAAANEASEGQLFATAGTGYELGAGRLYQRSASDDTNESWRPVVGAQSYTALLSASPDGQSIAFTGFASQREGDLYVLDSGDAEPRQITSDPGFEGAATWVSVP